MLTELTNLPADVLMNFAPVPQCRKSRLIGAHMDHILTAVLIDCPK